MHRVLHSLALNGNSATCRKTFNRSWKSFYLLVTAEDFDGMLLTISTDEESITEKPLYRSMR
jgi:hypothetical protein